MVSPQDTYEAGPNGNDVLRPNPGTNILTTNQCMYWYSFIHKCVLWRSPRMSVASEGLEGSHMSLVRLVSWGISSNTYYIIYMVYMGLSIKGTIPIGSHHFPYDCSEWQCVTNRRRGAYFGETALIEHEPQQDSAYAVGEVDLLLFFCGGVKWSILAKGHIHPTMDSIVNFWIFLRCMMIWWDFWCL